MNYLRLLRVAGLALSAVVFSACAMERFREEVRTSGAQLVVSETCIAHVDRNFTLWTAFRDSYTGGDNTGSDPRQFTASPDARHIAYVIRSDDRYTVFLNGVAGRPYQAVKWVVFSSDSRRLAYMAVSVDRHETVVVDGHDGATYDRVGPPVFSPDSAHVGFVAQRSNKFCWVTDGRETPFYDGAAGGLAFSPDGRHVAYGVKSGGREFFIRDGQPQKSYDFLNTCDPVFSPDGRHLAYVAGEGQLRESLRGVAFRPSGDEQHLFAVIDGVEGPHYGNVYPPTYSSDGTHVAYIGVVKIPMFSSAQCDIVLDGVARTIQHEIRPGLSFSPDGRRLAHIETDHFRPTVAVVDGVEDPHDNVTLPIFSADSRHVAYGAADRGDGCVVVDGRKSGSYPYPFSGPLLVAPVFSPDGKHIAQQILGSNVMVDDVPSRPTANRHGFLSGIVFDSNERFHYLEVRWNRDGNDVYLVEEHVPAS